MNRTRQRPSQRSTKRVSSTAHASTGRMAHVGSTSRSATVSLQAVRGVSTSSPVGVGGAASFTRSVAHSSMNSRRSHAVATLTRRSFTSQHVGQGVSRGSSEIISSQTSPRRGFTSGAQQASDDDEHDAPQTTRVVDSSVIFGNPSYMAQSKTNMSVARYYADVNSKKPRETWDYENTKTEWHTQDNYDVVKKLGRGKYSEVFAGIDNQTEEPVTIKILKPVKRKKIRREVLVLENLKGSKNITQLVDAVKDPVSKTCSIITSFVDGQDFKTLYPTFTDADVRFYMYQLLQGLDFAHSRGIMHRDIKPHNVMIDHPNRQLKIIDWGLAEFYHPHTEYNVRVASRYFKGPELLVNMRDYDYSLDIWSFGAMFAGIVFVVHPFFHGKDNVDQLAKIAQVVGSDDIRAYIQKYNIPNVGKDELSVIGNYPKKDLSSFVNSTNKHLATPDAIDLLTKCLVVDHNGRLSAKEAMAHPYFDSVREM